MKLIKKLLPIITVANVAAIVTPIATSCGAFQGHTRIDLETLSNNRYVRKTAVKAPVGVKNANEALALYLADVKKNKTIMADDLVELVEFFVMEYLDQSIRTDENEFKAKGIIDIDVYTINLADNRVSFEIRGSVDLEFYPTEEIAFLIPVPYGTLISMHLDVDLFFSQIQFFMTYEEYDTIEHSWSLLPTCLVASDSTTSGWVVDPWRLQQDKTWALDISIDGSSQQLEDWGLDIDMDINLGGNTQFSNPTIEGMFFSELVPMLQFKPNYLANVYLI